MKIKISTIDAIVTNGEGVNVPVIKINAPEGKRVQVKGLLVATTSTSSENVTSCIAGESLSGGRVVEIRDDFAFYYDPTNADSAGLVLGITKNAALSGGEVLVQTYGICYLPGQNLTSGRRYYAGLLGQLVETPGTVIVQQVGHSISSDKIVINFLSPIKTI